MDTLVSLLVVIVFLLVPLLPPLFARAARKAQERADRQITQHRQWVEASRPAFTPPPPARPLPEPRGSPVEYRSLEEIPERPISLETLPPRASSLEEVLPELSITRAAPAPPKTRRTSRVHLETPADVRRAILLAALLGPPRCAD